MHSDIVRGLAMLESVTQFHADHPLEVENERAAELFAEVESGVVDLRAMGGAQEFNRQKVSGTSSERQQLANRMRKIMRQIARVAKVLDRVQYPDARFKLRVPRSNGYQPLLNRVRVHLETVATMKHEFLKRGMPADFDTRLQALLDQFDSATKRKNSSLSGQMSSTAQMKERLRSAVRAVRELDVIMSLLYEDQPARYTVWRSASHIHRARRRGEKTSSPEANPLAATVSSSLAEKGAAQAGEITERETPPGSSAPELRAPPAEQAGPPSDPGENLQESNGFDSQLAFW